jgi:hypothetical protein
MVQIYIPADQISIFVHYVSYIRCDGLFALFPSWLFLLRRLRPSMAIDRPDVSGIAVPEVHIERFDTAFFSLDSNHIQGGALPAGSGIPRFHRRFCRQYPWRRPAVRYESLAFDAAREFLVSYLPIRDSLKKSNIKTAGVAGKGLAAGVPVYQILFSPLCPASEGW